MYDPSQNEVIQVLVEELEKDGGAAAPHDVIVKMGQRFGLSIDETNLTTDPANKLFRHKVYCAASVARIKRGLLEPTSKSGRGHWTLKSEYKQQMGKSSVDPHHIPPPVTEVEKPVTEAQASKIVQLYDISFRYEPKASRRLIFDLSMEVWVVLAVGMIATLLIIAGTLSSVFSAGNLLWSYPAWDWIRFGAVACLACLIVMLYGLARRRAGNSSKANLIIWGARLVGIVSTTFVVLGLVSILIGDSLLG